MSNKHKYENGIDYDGEQPTRKLTRVWLMSHPVFCVLVLLSAWGFGDLLGLAITSL